MLRMSGAAKTYLLKRRQAENERRRQACEAALEREVAAMSQDDRDAVIAYMAARIREWMRANYATLKPEVRQIADDFHVLDGH